VTRSKQKEMISDQPSSGGDIPLQQGAPGQMNRLEDPLPWLHLAYCFASVLAAAACKTHFFLLRMSKNCLQCSFIPH